MKRTMMTCLLACLFMVTMACQGSDDSSDSSSSGIFKIVLQPGLQPYTVYSGVSDTYISTINTTTNYNTTTTFSLENFSSAKNRALVKFDLKPLDPENVNVVKAYLTVRRDLWSCAVNPVITAYRMTKDWYASACWNYRTYDSGISWTAYGAEGDYETTPVSDVVTCYINRYDVTLELDPEMIEDWLQDESTNFGVMLKNSYEGTGSLASVTFCSSEYSTVDMRPKLTIYYSLP